MQSLLGFHSVDKSEFHFLFHLNYLFLLPNGAIFSGLAYKGNSPFIPVSLSLSVCVCVCVCWYGCQSAVCMCALKKIVCACLKYLINKIFNFKFGTQLMNVS